MHRSKTVLGAPRRCGRVTYRAAGQHIFPVSFEDTITRGSFRRQTANVQASLAGRYATALFELASDAKAIERLKQALPGVVKALGESADLHALTTNPFLSRDDAKSAIAAVAKSMKLDALTTNFLGVLAQNRRLAEIGNRRPRVFTRLPQRIAAK